MGNGDESAQSHILQSALRLHPLRYSLFPLPLFYTAAAPPTISEISFVIAAWRVLL
jgi:hypothetical protein